MHKNIFCIKVHSYTVIYLCTMYFKEKNKKWKKVELSIGSPFIQCKFQYNIVIGVIFFLLRAHSRGVKSVPRGWQTGKLEGYWLKSMKFQLWEESALESRRATQWLLSPSTLHSPIKINGWLWGGRCIN